MTKRGDYQREFGGASGSPLTEVKCSKNECINALRRVTLNLGKVPRVYDYWGADEKPKEEEILHYFEDWDHAIREANLQSYVKPENRRSKWIYGRMRNYIDDRVWDDVALEVRRRDDNKCQMCFEEGESYPVHHIIPVLSSGVNHKDNLITLCESCHGKAESYIKNITRDVYCDWEDDEMPEGRSRWTARESREPMTKSILEYTNDE